MGPNENRVSDIELRMAALAAAAAGCSGSEKGTNSNYVLRVAKQYEDYLRTGNCE